MARILIRTTALLWMCSPSHQFQANFSGHRFRYRITSTDSKPRSPSFRDMTNTDSNELNAPPDAEVQILQIAQSHFIGQALLALIRIGVIDVLQTTEALVADEIITEINARKTSNTTSSINREALFRCLRLVCTSGVVKETIKEVDGDPESAFVVTAAGMRLQNTADESMAPFILHWLERPLWDAWSQLPSFVENTSNLSTPPFDLANGLSASEYYLRNEESCSHRNSVARYASSKEIDSIIQALRHSTHLKETILSGKVVVDVGGGYGDFLMELKKAVPSIIPYCLDLPNVIKDAATLSVGKDNDIPTMIAGDMFDSATIPTCDIIFVKHVLCDFSDEDVVLALLSFRKALASSKEGKVVIMDAALPNGDNLNGKWNAAVSFDVLLMLSGRRGERSRLEWLNLAKKAGFVVEDVLTTSAVTVDLTVLALN